MLLAMGLAVFTLPCRGGADDAAIRLAVLPEGTTAEVLSAAELLTVQLSKAEGIELVERTEIDRILAEHELNASQMVRAEDRVSVGRLLGAQGLAFLAFDANNARWTLRLVDTRRGFLAGFAAIPSPPANDRSGMETIAQAALDRLLAFVPKLTIDARQQTRISILRVNDARLLPLRLPDDHIPVARVFPVLLMEKLSAEPGILILERHQLGDLRDEAQLTDDATAFELSNILIEGELALPLGELPEGRDSLMFTIRFLDAARRETGRFQQAGTSTALEALLEATAAGVVAALSELIELPADNRLAEEVESLLDLARRHGAIWAAEAAYALEPDNPDVQDTLIRCLVDRAFRILSSASRQEIRARAEALARAERICRDVNLPFVSRYFFPNLGLSSHGPRFLRNGFVRSDPETRRLLQPVRDAVRKELEENTTPILRKVNGIMEWGFFIYYDQPRHVYVRPLLDMILAETALPDQERDVVLRRILLDGEWPAEQYRELTDAADPVVRFYANVRLMHMQFLPERRRPYALAAFRDLETVMMPDHAIGGMSDKDNPFNLMLDSLIALIPDEADRIRQLAFDKMNGALNRGNLRPIIRFDYEKYLLQVADDKALAWIEAVKSSAQATGIMIMGISSFEMECLVRALAPVKAEIMSRRTRLDDPEPDILRRVMLARDLRDGPWRIDWPGELRQAWRSGLIVPQRLMLENDTLWIGVGGRISLQSGTSGRFGVHGCGLIKLDLPTGRVDSIQGGTLTGGSMSSTPWVNQFQASYVSRTGQSPHPHVYYVPVLPMFRWHDKIVVPQASVGVLLYPAEAGHGVRDLRSVEVVNEQSGLVRTIFGRVTASDDALFILTRGNVNYEKPLLMKWNRRSRATMLLFDPLQEMHPIRQHEQVPVDIQGFLLDRERRKVTLDIIGWHPVENRSSRVGRRAYWDYNLKTGAWSRKPAPKETDTSDGASRPAASPLAWPTDEPRPYGFVNWNEGTLGITGLPDDWKIEYYLPSTSIDIQAPEVAVRSARDGGTQPMPSDSLETFLDAMIQKRREGLPVTDLELRQTVDRFDRYCRDMIRKHNVARGGSGISIALQYIPPPDHTDIYLNWVRMALIHYQRYAVCLNPARTSAAATARPEIIRRLQSRFDPLYLFATIFSSISEDRGHAVRAIETLWEVDPFLARTAVQGSTNIRPLEAWMSDFYLEQGRHKEALLAAAMLGDTQTRNGIEAQALFLERVGDLATAERLGQRVHAEFDCPGALAGLYARQRDNPVDAALAFANNLDTLIERYFPDGMRHVHVRDFREPPRAGVQFLSTNRYAVGLGIRRGTVVVAVDGIQVQTSSQYKLVRDLDAFNPLMNLIVWNGNAYVDIVADLPNRRFYLRMGDYRP